MNPYIGKTLGPYQILEQIGQGGMATIFKAYQPSMDRYVAVKILPSHFTEDETFVARFTQEARTLARLEHPHILPVYDYGEQEGITYLVMRYVDAGTLKDLIAQQGPMALDETARLLGQVGSALEYAHSQGVIHRDIKPTNVLIQRGDAFLTDFGIAKLVAGTAQFTATGAIVGTPAYMSPEQGLGETVDHRSDIYGLGVVLYEMVIGRVPFEAETPLAVLLKHVNDPLPPPRHIKPDLPEAMERIILKATAKSPDDRFQTAKEMMTALQKAIAGVPIPIDEIEVPTTRPPVESPETLIPFERPTQPPPKPAAAPPPHTPVPTPAVAAPPRKAFPWLLVVVGGVAMLAVIAIAAVFILSNLGGNGDTDKAAVLKPTSTSRPTAPPEPSATPLPTASAEPTLTTAPTPTTEPTPTVIPSPTPTLEPTLPPEPITPSVQHFDGSGFAIDYPGQWEETTLDAMGLTMAIFTTRQLSMAEMEDMDFDTMVAQDPVVIVMVVPPDMAGDMGFDDIDSALVEFEDILPAGDADVIQQGDTTIGDVPGKIIVATGKDPDIGSIGIHLAMATLSDGTVLLMLGATPEQNLEQNMAFFEEMQNSFQYKGEIAPVTPVAPVAMEQFESSGFSIEYPQQWAESSMDAFGLSMAIFTTQQLSMEEMASLDFEELMAQDPLAIVMVVPPEMVSDMGFDDIDSAMDQFDSAIPEEDAEIFEQGSATIGGVQGKIVVAKGIDPSVGAMGIYLIAAERDDGTMLLLMGATPEQDLDLNLLIFGYMHSSFRLND